LLLTIYGALPTTVTEVAANLGVKPKHSGGEALRSVFALPGSLWTICREPNGRTRKEVY